MQLTNPLQSEPLDVEPVTKPGQGASLSYRIDGMRLLHRHAEMTSYGATERGGVMRPALSAEETAARHALLGWARDRRFVCGVDPIGNLFIRRPGTDPELPPILIGSHLDSQMPGGNFDGVYGVLAAFEVLETLEDLGVKTLHPVEAVVWMNEEGCRFSPSTMGSAVHAGELPLETALDRLDKKGISVREALGESLHQLGELEQRPVGGASSAYLEAHIEQGPLLEANGLKIGVVTNIQGVMQFEVTVRGEQAHAGTTPKYLRKDALQYALRLIDELSTQVECIDDRVRFTVGAISVLPGAINTIPSQACFSIDVRHPESTVLEGISDLISIVCRSTSGVCEVQVESLLHSAPVAFDPGVVEVIRFVAESLTPSMDVLSGATHDAKHMALCCPSGMIFIPCHCGISHNEAESAEPDDMVLGANVLLNSLIALDGRLDSLT